MKPHIRNEQMFMACKYCKAIIEPCGDVWHGVKPKEITCQRSNNGQHAPDIVESAREATSQ